MEVPIKKISSAEAKLLVENFSAPLNIVIEKRMQTRKISLSEKNVGGQAVLCVLATKTCDVDLKDRPCEHVCQG